MSFETSEGARSWKGALVALALIAALALAVFVLMGTQVSGILSTVGASVPSGGGVAQDDGSDDGAQDGGDVQPDEGGSDDGAAEPGGAGSGDDTGSSSGDSDGVPLLDLTRPDLLVIKTGDMTLQVDDVDGALNAATATVDRLGGYASGSSRSGAAADATAAITFRIPVAAWDAALIALRKLGGTILEEHAESEDVTAQVVDIDARVRNLRVTEAALQAIMTNATAIKDVLTVQDELTGVREEIEKLQSEAGHIRDQAGLSTLTLTFRRTPAPVVRTQEAEFDPMAETDAATAHLVSVLQAVAKVGIWLGIVWVPILVVVAFVGGIAIFVFRRFNRGSRAQVAGGI